MIYVIYVSYLSFMSCVSYMNYVCRLYELCKLHEYFMNHLKSVEISWNVIFFVFKNVEFFSWIYKYEKSKL